MNSETSSEMYSLKSIPSTTHACSTTGTSGLSITCHKGIYLLFLKSMTPSHVSFSFRPIYVNYEVLCNAFATKIIDLSKAEIYKVKNTEIPQKDFEIFLEE